MVKKISELYMEARKALLKSEDEDTAGLYARNLLCHYTGKTQEQIIADRELYTTEAVCEAVGAAVARICNGEPLAYILEEWDFYGMRLYINKNVLIPRDDTCAVTSLAIKQALFLGKDPRILDLCTGSGCIGLAIAHRVKDARITLADVSMDALAVARKNVSLQKMGARVSCVKADALQEPPAFMGKFDLIVSNPPYITRREMLELPRSVKAFEPRIALCGGEDGLDFYRAIVKNYQLVLKPRGFLCFEFGMGQGNDICSILEENGYTVLERVKDFNDVERAVLAQLNRKED